MPDRAALLKLKRDLGAATPDELAQLDAAEVAAEVERKRRWVLVGGGEGKDGGPRGGFIAVPPQLTLDEYMQKYGDMESPQLVLAPALSDPEKVLSEGTG